MKIDIFIYGGFFLLVSVISSFIWKKVFLKKKVISSDSVVLITGGSMGLGRELAVTLASRHKCHIIVYDIRADLSDSLLKDIASAGGKGYFYSCDISDKQVLLKTTAEVIQKFKRIDILVNNAAIVRAKTFQGHDEGELERVMAVNVNGPYILTREILPLMKKQGSGHVVTIASIVAHLYSPDTSAYTSSKAALFNLFSTLRLDGIELKREKSNIKTTIVCPWHVDTGMFKGLKISYTFFGLLGVLKTNQMTENIYEGIIYEKEEVYVPFYHQIVFRGMYMFPSWISDPVALWLTADAMKEFTGSEKKDK